MSYYFLISLENNKTNKKPVRVKSFVTNFEIFLSHMWMGV